MRTRRREEKQCRRQRAHLGRPSENRLQQQNDYDETNQKDDPDGAAKKFEHAARIAAACRGVCKGSGSREWDRTTDHLHVKEVLYH